MVARGLSLALSLAMLAALFLVPGILTRGDALLSRAVLPVLLLGVAGGIAYGVGYRPRSPLLAAMLGPWVSWPLMASAMAFLLLATEL
jgi:predicted membrane protein